MATIVSNLYPPIMLNVTPSFIRTANCRVYFSVSQYNSVENIENVQISLTNIKTNASVLKQSLYPAGIKLAKLWYDPNVEGDFCYYVIIKASDLTTNEFLLNQYYKVQMRFTSTDAEYIDITDTPQSISKWLADNIDFFSEWSRASLIRGVSQPSVTMNYLTNNDSTTLSAPLLKLTGELHFSEEAEQDYLAEYNVKVYSNNKLKKDGLIFDSGKVYPDPKKENIIDCDLLCNFQDNVQYTIYFTYTTNYLYSEQIYYVVTVQSQPSDNPYDLTIAAAANGQNGYINIHMTMDNHGDTFSGKQFLLRRSSSRNNFQTWQNLYYFNYSFSALDWQDLSIENGVWYKYCLCIVDLNYTTLYTPIYTEPVLCIFEDIFLINDNIQLRLKFNPAITGFKYNVSQSQQVTLGAKFPYVKRNGNNFYRTFNINGLISSLIDETNWYSPSIYIGEQEEIQLPNMNFTSKEDEYKNSYDLYTEYEANNNISNYLNPIYERFFRQTVQEFLCNTDVKLFKSPTEGNILIKLTGINFEPMASLGRVLYSFSATAVEIDEATFDNYKKYDVLKDDIFELMTESPALNVEHRFTNEVLVINANGISQDRQQNWVLHLEPRIVRGGQIV